VRVKMKTTAAGPEGVFQADQEVVVSDKLGQAFVECGYAVEVKVSSPAAKAPKSKPKKRGRKKATKEPPETATIPEADEA
jgi:hypothetical protein